jgi:hypothetical protein
MLSWYGVVVKMKIWKKDNNSRDSDELAYLLWQAELDKELSSFWKSITKTK